MGTNHTNHAPPEPSADLRSTIDRVRQQRAAFGDPTQPLVHRVRNAATEKQYSESPWCGAICKQGDNATIIDGDVTCPACQQIIASLSKDTGRLPLTHFADGGGETLCGRVLPADRQAADVVPTLRETTCSECQDAAEELIVGLIGGGGKEEILSATKPVMDLINKTIETRRQADQTQEQIASSLSDIAETLKTINHVMIRTWTEDGKIPK